MCLPKPAVLFEVREVFINSVCVLKRTIAPHTFSQRNMKCFSIQTPYRVKMNGRQMEKRQRKTRQVIESPPEFLGVKPRDAKRMSLGWENSLLAVQEQQGGVSSVAGSHTAAPESRKRLRKIAPTYNYVRERTRTILFPERRPCMRACACFAHIMPRSACEKKLVRSSSATKS